jgi:hypothetical protein
LGEATTKPETTVVGVAGPLEELAEAAVSAERSKMTAFIFNAVIGLQIVKIKSCQRGWVWHVHQTKRFI